MPEINKSTRHSKITGDFAEALVLYLLSKHGFECARIDHIGIDLLARNPNTNELMGISVKSRSRNIGTENTNMNISIDNFEKIDIACKAFGCKPYFAIVIDQANSIIIYIMSKEKFLELSPLRKTVANWKMRPKYAEKYKTEKEIISIEFKSEFLNWWPLSN